MKVVIIDYGAGNIFSVQQAFRRLGIQTVLTKSEEEIRSATHVVFPGVGHAKSAMEQLIQTKLDKVIPTLKQPVLGICLGMQLMCGWNEEGDLDGLGIFDTKIFDMKKRIQELENSRNMELEKYKSREFDNYRRTHVNTGIEDSISDYKFPHIGWNDVKLKYESEVFYFVHGFAAEICESTIGVSQYPFPFSAALRKNNFWGVQFHPEKSGQTGENLLKQFLVL